MKASKIAATALTVILSGCLLLAMGCSSANAASTAKSSVATVQKGSLAVSVTGTGNLALSTSQDLAFQIAGYVAEVLVKEGQSVTKGQELAKLDTSEWEKQIKALDKALVTAQRNLDTRERALTKTQDQVTAKDNAITKAQRDVTSRENDIARAERQVAAKELAVRQAELDLQTAQENLTQISQVKTAQDAVDDANFHIDFAKSVLRGAQGLVISDPAYWLDQEIKAKDELATAQLELANILNGTSVKLTSDAALQVKKAQLQVEQSQRAFEEAKIAVDDAKFAVDDAQLAKKDAELAVKDALSAKADAEQAVADAQTSVDDAKQSLADAQADLDEAKSLSPIVTAPIDGFIPKINVKGGDEVFKGTVAMQLADPNQYEANILVAEKNISNLKVGQSATISLDALSGITFPAEITKIATLATASSGVVNYQVTIKLTSLQPISKGIAAQPSAGVIASTSNTTSAATAASATVSLKSGMSAVVTIVIQQKDNVLKVPSRAITRQGQNSTVEVVTTDGTETRIVKTGMSDNSNTEITEGLSEGEQVVIKTSASTTSSTTTTNNQQQAPPAGGPGLGGILR